MISWSFWWCQAPLRPGLPSQFLADGVPRSLRAAPQSLEVEGMVMQALREKDSSIPQSWPAIVAAAYATLGTIPLLGPCDV